MLAAVPTRWNSALIMLQRLAKEEVWRAVSDTLLKAKTCKVTRSTKVPRLTVQRTQIHELVSLLEPFDEATQALQGDGVTLSRVIPALLGIDESLANCGTQLINLKRNLRRCLYERFQELIQRPEYIVATILDCRYKLLPFTDTRSTTASHLAGYPVLTPCNASDARTKLVHCLSTYPAAAINTVTAVPSESSYRSVLDMQELQDNASAGIVSERRSIFSRYETRQVRDT